MRDSCSETAATGLCPHRFDALAFIGRPTRPHSETFQHTPQNRQSLPRRTHPLDPDFPVCAGLPD